jgi:hypothetical protein
MDRTDAASSTGAAPSLAPANRKERRRLAAGIKQPKRACGCCPSAGTSLPGAHQAQGAPAHAHRDH